MRTRLTAVSFVLAMAASTVLLVAPVSSGFDGERAMHATLLQVVVRIFATIAMGGFVLVSDGSIGLFYLPAGILMLLAPCVEPAKFRDVFW